MINAGQRPRVRTPRPAIPHSTLPAPGARLTKRNMATYSKFNAVIETLLQERGAVLVRDWPMTEDTLHGHALRTWRLNSTAGALEVTPCGAWVACRAEDPAALARIVGTLPVNLVSGKWNHHFWSWGIEDAVASFARELDRMGAGHVDGAVRGHVSSAEGAGAGGCVVGAGGCGCIALAVGGGS